MRYHTGSFACAQDDRWAVKIEEVNLTDTYSLFTIHYSLFTIHYYFDYPSAAYGGTSPDKGRPVRRPIMGEV